MSLFKKKNDKKDKYLEDTERLEQMSDEAKAEESDKDGLDNLFSSLSDMDSESLDFSEDDIGSILDKYISDQDVIDEVPDDLMIPKDSDQKIIDAEEISAKLDLSEAVERETSEQSGLSTDAVDSSAPDQRELTTDEAIEEFMKNVSLGGSISELLSDTETVSEDGLEIPVFAEEGKSESEADAIQSLLPSDIEAPTNIEDIDFNTADTETVGSTDMNLRIAFGLEEEDDDSDEMKDAVKKMGDHFETDRRVGKKFQPEHPEYTDASQARDIAGEYKTRKRNVSIRLFLSVVFVLILLVFENITTITELITGSPKQFAGILDPAVYPVVYIMVSLQILLFAAVCALPELRRGVKRMFAGAPTPESITVFVLFAAVVASAVTAYQASVTVVPSVYNAVAAMSVVMTLIYARLNVKREMITFFIAGSKKKKYAMNRVPDNETLLTPDNYEDDMYGDVMRVEKTGFVDGFFSRMGLPDGMTGAFSAGLIGVAIAAAILFSIFASSDNTVSGICETAYVTILALLPFCAHITFSYPFYRVSKTASECESAIVGETSLEEYAATAVVSFDDGNVFPSYGVKVQNIKIYNNARIDRVLYYASSAFKYAGGPLSDVFEVATMEMGRSENVQITDADKGYLAANVDGVGIVFGSYPSLIERGFDISDTVALDDVDFSDELSIMYMFREGMLIAKLYIKYVLDGDIEPILRQFQDYGMYLCVRTYDPNIDEDMICAKLSIKNPPVKVVRYRSADDVRGVVDRVDSGFVTYGSPKSLLQLLPYCDKTIHTKRTCGALTVMSVILALMLLALTSMSKGFSGINSLYITAYHIVWTLFTYIASKIFIR